MAKNRYAQLLYGKVLYIFETHLKKEDLPTIFDPSTYWVDVTGQDCEVGYIAAFVDGVGIVLSPPPEPEPPTLDELKATKLTELKTARNAEEKSPLEYGDKLFDYDDDSRDRLAIARQMIEDSGGTGTIEWTMADNTRAAIGLDDFKGVTAAAAVRSNTLHIKYNELKTQVEAVDDNASDAADQVAAIVWSD